MDDSGNAEGSTPDQTRLHQERQASLVERCQAGSGSGRSLGLPGIVRLGRKRGETSLGFSPRGDPQEIRNRLVIQPTGPRFWALYKNICNDQYHEILRLREIEQKYDEAIRQNEITFNQNNSISTDENINTKILYQLSIGSDSTGNNILNATECLKIINTLAPDRIIILKEAWKSAKEIDSDFKNTNTLIKLLARLTTSFYDELQKPGGNPRSVFTSNEYAANESDSTTNSDKLQKQREFLFDNRKLQMNSHLKIGTSDNINFTIRVHFCFDSPTQKVIIGWCGKHLNISSR